ncbi:hypothetical protein D3C74_446340 [compost metagenome]|jgi:preprotein translocase subunit YajC
MKSLHLGKGDIVRTSSGITGEVVELWGIARSFVRIMPECGKSIPMFARDVVEVVKRAKSEKEAKKRR